MSLNVMTTIDYIYEAVNFLHITVNDDIGEGYKDPEALMASVMASYDVPEDALTQIFKDALALYEGIRHKINVEDPMIQYFFKANLCHKTSMGLLAFMYQHGDESDLENYMASFVGLNDQAKHKELTVKLLSIMVADDEVAPLVRSLDSEKKLFDYLEEQEIEAESKWYYYKFYRNADAYLVQIGDVLKSVIKAMKEQQARIEAMIKPAISMVNELIEAQDFEEKFSKIYHLNLDPQQSMVLYPQIMISNGITLMTDEMNDVTLYLSALYHPVTDLTTEYTVNIDQIANDLKVIGDRRKFEILCMLKEKPMYGQEIADCLSLTTATVSHHMSQLIERKMVTIEKRDHRIYYSLSVDGIEELIINLRRILLS